MRLLHVKMYFFVVWPCYMFQRNHPNGAIPTSPTPNFIRLEFELQGHMSSTGIFACRLCSKMQFSQHATTHRTGATVSENYGG